MSLSFVSLYNQIVFLLSTLTWVGIIDLLLVSSAFYLILSLIRRSSAGYLLREVLIIGLGLLILTALLPLPVFDWLVRGFLVAMLVAIPVIFQAPLRNFLERLGRTSGLASAARQSTAESVLPELVHAVEDMAESRTGALIVLEGANSLSEIAKTGIQMGSQVTSELLQSIFYSGTPLHDGAVIARTNRIIAAGCVLPLTNKSLPAEKRLGTRHRAAVGMSEVSDALVIVVSEETGAVGAARHGVLERPINSAELREKLQAFYDPSAERPPSVSVWEVINTVVRQLWHPETFKNPRELLASLGLLLVSMTLSMVIWSFVIEQTNAIELVRFDEIPFRVENVPADMRIVPPPPNEVTAVVQTTKDMLPSLSSLSFQGVSTFEEGATAGLYRLPVDIEFGVDQVMLLSVEPTVLDLELAAVVTNTLPVQVMLLDQDSMSPAFELTGATSIMPTTVTIQGPEPVVNRVDQATVSVSVANANTTIRETRSVRLVDENGLDVPGLTMQPNQVRVMVPIQQRVNASDVSVQAVITGTLPAGYQFRNISVTPRNVTLRGSADQLSVLGGVVNTRPVDVSQVVDVLSVQVPLDLPPNIQAVDSSGSSAKTVSVRVQVTPLEGNLTMSRPVELLNVTPSVTTTALPQQVDLLITGPVPTLAEIEQNPTLIRILVDAAGVRRGQTITLSPQVVAPPEVQVQVVPPSVQVVAEAQPEEDDDAEAEQADEAATSTATVEANITPTSTPTSTLTPAPTPLPTATAVIEIGTP